MTQSKPKHKALPAVAPRLRYQKNWDLRNDLHARRKQDRIPDVLMLTDHPPIYTLGKNAKQNNLLIFEWIVEFLEAKTWHRQPLQI